MPSSMAARVTQAPGAVWTGIVVKVRGRMMPGSAMESARVRLARSMPAQARPIARPGARPGLPSLPPRKTWTVR